DTIVAVATPPGVGAVAMLRISGHGAQAAMSACFCPYRSGRFTAATLRRGELLHPQTGERLDDAMAVLFFAPRSYTGEDVAELHVHGGAGVVASCLAAVLTTGARLAEPGEFTRRAFQNGRMDLAQAEAVADLINAESRLAAKAAAARLEGSLGRALRALRDELTAWLVEIEAHVDFPDEVPSPPSAALGDCIAAQRGRIAALLAESGPAKALRDGISCVIAGPPNAGKSSLMNALLDAERAIVSHIPGTTRDIVEDRVAVDGVVLQLRDTAGLRIAADEIEAEGIHRARKAIAQATLVLLVIDGSQQLNRDGLAALAATSGMTRIVLCNKSDLGTSGLESVREAAIHGCAANRTKVMSGSVRDRRTIDAVRSDIAALGWGGGIVDPQATLVANSRQVEALTRAQEALTSAAATVAADLPIDLVSLDLRVALAACAQLTGEAVDEAVLDGIFARFCVGK
ncbi:MAG: tRNA uridine-5-carboxymethylaminomethyl(34) synthesis GTPase MnmE, partial [Candidatus Eremiobacteraeota bacterium]|nr:tRNA uridine-5-carboxymethylaminomethyl(34) synthesis GTPase MnmE [Candidatus Eremiobacteraeota bacterium]